MARNISTTVIDAAGVSLMNPVKIYGENVYTISSDFIGWGESNNYRLQDIALTFGTRVSDTNMEVVGSSRKTGFRCGDAVISVFDFALLYNVFNVMIMAKVEFGSSIHLHTEKLKRAQGNFIAQWFGSYCLLYSVERNVILNVRSQDVEAALTSGSCAVKNFCQSNTFNFTFDGADFALLNGCDDSAGVIGVLSSHEFVRRAYARHFTAPDVAASVPDVIRDLEPDSALGQLVGEAEVRTECLDALKQYRSTSCLNSIAAREDLFVVPQDRYPDINQFFGSVCYTDKEQIAVAVNFRQGLFVYYPWFVSDEDTEREVLVDTSAKFDAFYNVTDGCNRIYRFAETVTVRPLTAAEFDLATYAKIRDAFLSLSLPRIPIQSAFGRVVIPESVLVRELTIDFGESIYCLLPVGVVGNKVVCLSANGTLTAMTPSDWGIDGAFFDITEVIK